MLTRRGFLGTLLASVAALTVDPQTLLWKPAGDLTLPPVTPEALLTLKQITQAVLLGLTERLEPRRLVTGTLIGQTGLTDQFTLAMDVPDTVGADGLHARFIAPIVAAFTNTVQHEGIQRFGVLQLGSNPYAEMVTAVAPTGIAIRGMLAPDDYRRKQHLRFDIICGKAA